MECNENSTEAEFKGLRVLNVCETAKGGIATYINLLWKIHSNDQSMRFIVQDAHRSQLAAEMPVETFFAGKRALNPLRLALCTFRSVRAFKPDIIFFHSSFTLPVMAALRLLRVRGRFVYCAHGWAANRYDSSSFKHKVIKFIERHLLRFADAVVNISGHDLRYAQDARYPGTHILIENAVESISLDIVPRTSRTDDNIRLLFVGRFDRQKGLDILLSAIEKLAEKRPCITLSIIGDAVLDDATQAFQDSDRITFHGWVEHEMIAAYYANADLLVVPSRWEGFGLVVAEAMRAGTPAFVSDRGNLPDIIQPGRTGYVVPLSVEAFTDALLTLDKASLVQMRPACAETFQKRFHQVRFASEIQALFLRVLK